MRNQSPINSWMPRWQKWTLFLALLVIAAAIGVLDYYTGPALLLEILYFIPITIAAWRLGRAWAYGIVAADIISTYVDQVGQYSYLIVLGNIFALGLTYIFVAELVYRLVQSRLELSRTTARLREVYDAVDSDVEAASLLQATVLENPIPIIPGLDIAARLVYARTIGGDFWEAIQAGNSLHLAVADVAGKSVQAALFTTLLKHLLDEARGESDRLDDVVDYVNSQLEKRLPDGMFVSMFYGCLNINNRELSYVNAGHEPALIYRSQTDEFLELMPTVMVMGLQEYEEHPKAETVALNAGDLLVSYTDGVTEPKMPSGDRLEAAFLRQKIREFHGLPSAEIVDRVIQEIERLTGQAIGDDIALLCVKALPRD